MHSLVFNLVGQKGYDCIGLVKHVCEIRGVPFPNLINARLLSCSITDLQSDDVICFDFHGKGVDHLGVYLGDNKFIHSLDTTGVIISNINHRYYERRYKGVVGG